MKLSHRLEGDICVVHIDGELIREQAPEFQLYLIELLKTDHLKGLVIDMSEAIAIDSAGIGAFKAIFQEAENIKIGLAFCQLGGAVLDIIKITSVDVLIPAYTTETEAMAHVTKSEK